MSRGVLKNSIGALIIFVHALSFWGIVWYKKSYIPDSERLDIALILLPVTAVYVTAIVRSAIKDQTNFNVSPIVNMNYVFVTMAIALLFCSALLLFVFDYPNVSGPTTTELRRWLLVLEIAFGASFGLIAEDLFGTIEKQNLAKER